MNAQLKIAVLLLWFLLRESIAIPSFTPPVEVVCIGEELTFSCSISDTSAPFQTFWRVDPQQCTNGLISLLVSGPSDEDTDTCGNFTAQTTGSDGDCYTSTLTVTASPGLSGTGVTCSDNSGNVAGNTTILIDTGALELDVASSYDYATLRLKRIQSKWNAPCSSVTEYNITVDCGTFVYTSLVPLAACPGGTCVSEVNIASGATSDCTVSVSAAALNEQIQVPLNDEYLNVMIVADNDPTVVTHSFQTGFPGMACFSIESTFVANEAELLVNMAKSTNVCRGESTDTLEVSIPPATEYSFVARTFDCGCGPGQFQQSVIIEGTGTTGGCFVAQLFGGNINERCQDGCNGGGCVKYATPLSPGDSVTYESCDGYKLEGSDILTCLQSGQWSGSPPTGVPAGQSIFNIVVIILIVVAVLLLLIAITFMVCFIVYYCEAKNLKKVAGEQRLGSPSELKTY